MNQWEKRIVVLNNIYSFLLTNKKNIINKEKLDSWILDILEYALDQMEKIISVIKPYLTESWSWERILPINQAILIMAYSEKIVFKTDKAILINEAVKNAKNYSDEAAYKFINSVLDKIL